MATPAQKAQKGVLKPGDEGTADAAGMPTAYTVHIVLRGTKANVQADWATLIALSFASGAVITWDKA